MTPQRWREVRDLFDAAANLPTSAVDEFLRVQCEGDAELYAEVHRLLQELSRSGLLDRPVLELVPNQGTPVFAAGQTIAGRYYIVRFLGRGGMGEVYEAKDLELKEQVALKTLLAPIAADARMIDLFKKEIQLSRKVSHPNVCRVFDLAWHPAAGSFPETVLFLTMEFLDGETLSAKLQREGRMSEAAAQPLIEQMATALDTAHRAGVIHRDFKPSNVMLVPAGEGVRAVVTDFGLARRLVRANDATLSLSENLVGTPDYMAPELLTGSGASVASDIYAFGMVAYKMVTGALPFSRNTPLAAAILRSKEGVPSPKFFVPDLDPTWDRVILRMLAPEPSRRYGSAEAAIRELTQPRAVFGLAARLHAKFTRRWVITGGSFAGLVASYYAISRYINWRPPLPAAPLVMLTPLKHASDDSIESGALDVTLTNQLSQSAHLRLLSRERLERFWRLIQGAGLEQTPPRHLETRMVRDIALRSGTQIVVFGSFGRVGDQRTLTLQMELMGSSPDRPRESWFQHFDTSRPSDLAAMGHEAAAWVRRTVGESEKELEARNRPPEELTTPYWPALQEYVAAEESSRAGEPDAAVLHLKTALRIDPEFALGLARLADILRSQDRLDEALDYWSKAAQILGRRNLTDRESLRIRGLFAADTGQWGESEQIFERYVLEYPDDSLPLFYRADALDCLGRYEEAERLLTLAVQRNSKYSYVMGRANFYLSRGRLDDAEKDWRTGRELNPRDWTDRIRMAIAFARGDSLEVHASLDHLKSDGTTIGKSQAYVLEACLCAERGDLSGAEKGLNVGLAFDRTMGLSTATQLEKQYLLAQMLLAGQPDEAVRIAATALSGDHGRFVRMQFGSVLAQVGHIQAAKKCLISGLPDWPVYQFEARRLEGEIAFASQDFTKAVSLFRQAVQPPHRRTFPDFLVRAALAVGDYATAEEALRSLFFAPGIYCLGIERNTPGFVRTAIETVQTTAKWPDLLKQIDSFRPFIG